MNKLSTECYLTLREGAKVIEVDTHRDKLLLLTDGTYLKLFRVKRLLTSARFSPYSKRFSKNAKKLIKLGKFIRELHDKGVYFRSLNLGNIVLTPENKLGLIDIPDIRVYGKTLPAKLRVRNFMHMSRYADDNPVTKKTTNPWFHGYFNKKNCYLTPDQMNNCF